MRAFSQVQFAELKARGLPREYLLTLALTPEQISQRYNISFAEIADEPLVDCFASVCFAGTDLYFELYTGCSVGKGTTCVCAVGGTAESLDARSAYQLFMSEFKPLAKEVVWISDEI
ncbi:MAG: hypothetical protein LCH63_18975 [Candidatus Melainabacteria bacterium]|nr:hypothetical protein [Candidatus Melainabacteria bacterium]